MVCSMGIAAARLEFNMFGITLNSLNLVKESNFLMTVFHAISNIWSCMRCPNAKILHTAFAAMIGGN
jgi:hypothetical protein